MKNFLLVLGLVSLLVSCGKQPQVIKSIGVQTEVINNEVILKVQTQVEMGNISFPFLTLPIVHPRLNLEIGQVVIAPLSGSLNLLEVDLNFTALLSLNLSTAQLPNGGMVPLMNNEEVITVKIDDKVYLYINPRKESFSIGLALPFKTLDVIGQNIGNTSLFPVFAIDKAWGSAGIFTGRQSGQSGFGLFANISQYVQNLNWTIPSAQKGFMARKIQVTLPELKPSENQKDYIEKKIVQMHKKNVTLQYE